MGADKKLTCAGLTNQKQFKHDYFARLQNLFCAINKQSLWCELISNTFKELLVLYCNG